MTESTLRLRTLPGANQDRTGQPAETEADRIADRRFRHPGYEAFRTIVREVVVPAGVLDEGDAIVLISHGVEAAAQRIGVSGRTIRRRCEAAGVTLGDLVLRVRLDAAERAARVSVPTAVVASWLGFRNPDSYRRFVKRELGVSVKQLRPRVRESPFFVASGG